MTIKTQKQLSNYHFHRASHAKNRFGRLGHRIISIMHAIPIIGAVTSLFESKIFPKQISSGHHPVQADAPIKIQKQDFSLEPLKPIEKTLESFAARSILKTKGFSSDEGDTIYRENSVGCCQGSKEMRLKAAEQTKIAPEALEFSELRKHKHINLQTYLIFTFKRFAHTFGLAGKHTILGAEVSLEGFNEIFTIPLVAASFKRFDAGRRETLEFSSERVIQQLLNTTFSDTTSDEDIRTITAKIKDPNFKGPISIGSGDDWHYTTVIFYRDYLINCNRSEAHINIYKIDREKVTEEMIRTLAKRYDLKRAELDLQDSVVALINDKNGIRDKDASKFHALAFKTMKLPKVGSCTYNNAKSGLLGLMAVDYLSSNYNLDNISVDQAATLWDEALKKVYPIYKEWTFYTREEVLDEFLFDAKEYKNIEMPTEEEKAIWNEYSIILGNLEKRMLLTHSHELRNKVLDKLREFPVTNS